MCSVFKTASKNDRGQATVEAAFALPILLIVVLILLQPGIVLYDKIVMNAACAEGCRLLATSATTDGDINEDYIRRRLSAVPQIDIFHFHSGGCSWDIDLSGGENNQTVSVTIKNELKPLPLIDIGMSIAGITNDRGNIEIQSQSSAVIKQDWVSSSTSGVDMDSLVKE